MFILSSTPGQKEILMYGISISYIQTSLFYNHVYEYLGCKRLFA